MAGSAFPGYFSSTAGVPTVSFPFVVPFSADSKSTWCEINVWLACSHATIGKPYLIGHEVEQATSRTTLTLCVGREGRIV